MTPDRIIAAGEALAEAWLTQRPMAMFAPGSGPRTDDEAYDIQDVMARAIGERAVGWKVGGTFAGPIAGRVFASRLMSSPAQLDPGRYVEPFLECELALRLTEDLPPRIDGYSVERLRQITTLHLTVEMTTSRIVNGPQSPRDAEEWRVVVADNTAAAGIIEGPEVADWHGLDLRAISAMLLINGAEVTRSNPPEERRDPVETLSWLTRHLGGRGIEMLAGQIISTGSITTPRHLANGARAVVDYGDFGRIEVRGP